MNTVRLSFLNKYESKSLESLHSKEAESEDIYKKMNNHLSKDSFEQAKILDEESDNEVFERVDGPFGLTEENDKMTKRSQRLDPWIPAKMAETFDTPSISSCGIS